MSNRALAISLVAGLAATAGAQTLDQSRAYAADLAADAGGRTSSLAQKGGEFTVNVHGFTQFRYNWNHRDDNSLDNENTIGFQNARTKITLGGNVGNENWGYFIQFKFEDPGAGMAALDDAYGTYKMEGGWTLKFGQFKLPLFREELVGDTFQLFANRSVTNSVFTQSRSQGVQFGHEGDSFRFFGAFSDGLSTKNTDFNSASEADYAFTGRLEWKWAGAWKQASDFTSFQNSDYFGMVGFAAHYQNGGDTFATTDASAWDLTADLSVEGNGWNAFAAVIYSNFDPNAGSNLADWAFQVQGGVFVAPQWELIAGWDILIPDSDRSNGDNFSTIRLGFNHYFIPDSHAAKLTVDLSWFLDTQDQSIVPQNTQTGLLASSEDTQWNLRAQIQLMF